MISRYGGIEILASITEDEIVESFLSIVRMDLNISIQLAFECMTFGLRSLVSKMRTMESMESSLTHY